MTPELFGLLFLLGGGVLALWIYVRWPALMPTRLAIVLLHVAAAAVVGSIGRHAIALLASYESAAASLVAIFGVGLPALTYALLVAVWVLATLKAAFPAGR
jgi:hypothetical protein